MPLISCIKIKASNSNESDNQEIKEELDTDSTTVADLKKIINKGSSTTDASSSTIRLIYSGRVLKDDQLLSTYNIQSNHTIHLVRTGGGGATGGASSSTSTTASSTTTTTPITLSTPQIPPIQPIQPIHQNNLNSAAAAHAAAMNPQMLAGITQMVDIF